MSRLIRQRLHLVAFLSAIFLLYLNLSSSNNEEKRLQIQEKKPIISTQAVVKNDLNLPNISIYNLGIQWCHFPPVRLLDPPTKNLTGLVSFPGSGNTWLRYLLQQATGIATGSVYLDEGLAEYGFPGENIQNASMLVVKTHQMPNIKHFDKIILLIRQPMDAIRAEFNRRIGGHNGFATYSDFQSSKWKDFVQEQSEHWYHFYKAWLEFKGPMLVLNYDDLVSDTFRILFQVLKFLDFPPVTHDIWNCLDSNSKGNLHRPKLSFNFNVFTYEMRYYLNEKYEKIKSMIV